MAQPDLKSLNLRELKLLQKKVDRAIATHEKRARKDALNAVKDKAKELGFSLKELVGGHDASSDDDSGATRTPSAPKYSNPDDATQTWTGRGRKPNWIKDAIDGGADIETMRIND
ncbi:H-NS histone family protein [Rhodobacteraceae bacterium KMM 6894]|nr:H-NS histone family protein [Rhodobacteraceae bacterium KMM 6894]